MSTTAIAKGRAARLLMAYQSAFETPAASGYFPTSFYSLSLRERFSLEADPLIGGTLHNGNDAGDPVDGLSEHGGDIEVPLDLNHIGYWLKLALGAPVTTGSTDLTHVFSSGAAQLPSATLEVKNLSNDFRQHVGCVATSLGLQVQDQAGTQRAKLSLIGRNENLLTSTGAGTPAAAAVSPFPAALGLLRINGVAAGSVLSASLDYRNGAQPERYVDGGDYAGAVVLAEEGMATGEIRVRYQNTTLEAIAIARTNVALEIEWQKSSTKLLNLSLGRVRIERSGVPISGPGGLEATFGFRAAQSASAPMLVATLKNTIASY